MEPQTQPSKDTVTMTVEIPKSARTKLGRLKGIYGCDSLACTVSSIVDDVVLSDALVKVADKERMTEGLSHNDPIPTPDQPIGDPMQTTEVSYDEGSDERSMIDFCSGLIIEYRLRDINELKSRIYSGGIEIVDHRSESDWDD